MGEDIAQSLLQVCKKVSCAKKDCQDIFSAAKSLASQNACLSNQIKALEKKVQHLEHELKKSSVEFLGDDCMLGPTQIKCLANKSTKGRNWTEEEKSKARTLKKMTSNRCYNYIRKNIVPLPCPTELLEKNTFKYEEAKLEQMQNDHLTTETFVINTLPHVSQVKSEEIEGTEQIVHHVVIPPEVWAAQDGDQKFEFIVTQE